MRWRGHKHYAESNKGYRVSKNNVPPKYIAYTPNGEMLRWPAFYTFREARLKCEEHYNEKKNRQI